MVNKVVVFGSCNLDMFFDVPNMAFFSSSGIGAEDALHFNTHKQAPGGKGANQAVAAAKAGAKVHFYGAMGSGAHSRFLISNFKKLGINTSGILETKEPTGVAIIFTQPNGAHKMVVSHGANMLAKSKQVPDSVIKNSVLVFQAETDLKENGLLMKRGRKLGAKIVLNVAPAAKIPARDLKSVDYLILNRAEAEVLAGGEGMDASNITTFAQTMAKKFGLMCIITMGKKGVMAVSPKEPKPLNVPSLAIKAIDTVGAGDAFAGAFSAALAEGKEPIEALHYGVVAGALACTKIGAQTALPTAAEIKKHLPKPKNKAK